MKVYDKLIRDRIPEIIEASGSKYEVEVVSDEVALEYLYKKLGMEVLFAIGKKYGYSEKELMDKRNQKNISRGSFDKNIILKKTY